MLAMYMALIDDESDKEKFERLYNTYETMMKKLANSILHNTALAEETVQDCFLKLAMTITEVPDVPSKRAKAMITVMVKNKARNNLELEHYDVVVPTEDDDFISDSLADNVATAVGYEKMLQAVKELDFTYRDIIIYKYLFGFSAKKYPKFWKFLYERSRLVFIAAEKYLLRKWRVFFMNIEYRNKLFDFVMTEALKEYMDIELKEVDEIVAKEPPFEFSPQYKKKMCKIINSVSRKDRIKQFKHVAVKSAVSVAVAVSLIFGGLLTQPEVFAAVQNVFRSVLDKYDKYEFAGEELTVDNFDNSFRLGYVPDGYYLTEGNYSRIFVTLVYSNEVDTIKFKYGISDDWTSYYDNEHNSYDTFYHNGIEYHYYESNNADFYSTLIWYENGYSFSVLAHLPKDEFVKIAENVEN